MANNSAISWTNDTWNPWQGCQKVSLGCKFCYMYRDKVRYGQNPSRVVRSSPATFNAPLQKLKGPLVFTCSWSDFFVAQADEWRDEAWDIIRQTPRLTYQILTKRPERISAHLPADWGDGWPNVWLGVSVEATQYLSRVLHLGDIPAQVRFVSYEPALEYVNFKPYAPLVDWLISGGESGPGVRAADLNWFRRVRDDCLTSGIIYFHKQHGGPVKVNGDWGGRELDGRIHDQMPPVVTGNVVETVSQLALF